MIFAWFHFPEVQSFNDPNTRTEQRLMRLDAVAMEPANGKIIDTHGLHAAGGEILRGLFGNINEVFVKLGALPNVRRIVRLEKDSFPAADAVSMKFSGLDGFFVADRDHSSGANRGVQRHSVQALAP